MINFFNCDSIEFIKSKPDKYYDLAIIDPPYGINMDGGKYGIDGSAKAKNYSKKEWDEIPPPYILLNYNVLVKIKLFGEQTTLWK